MHSCESVQSAWYIVDLYYVVCNFLDSHCQADRHRINSQIVAEHSKILKNARGLAAGVLGSSHSGTMERKRSAFHCAVLCSM